MLKLFSTPLITIVLLVVFEVPRITLPMTSMSRENVSCPIPFLKGNVKISPPLKGVWGMGLSGVSGDFYEPACADARQAGSNELESKPCGDPAF